MDTETRRQCSSSFRIHIIPNFTHDCACIYALPCFAVPESFTYLHIIKLGESFGVKILCSLGAKSEKNLSWRTWSENVPGRWGTLDPDPTWNLGGREEGKWRFFNDWSILMRGAQTVKEVFLDHNYLLLYSSYLLTTELFADFTFFSFCPCSSEYCSFRCEAAILSWGPDEGAHMDWKKENQTMAQEKTERKMDALCYIPTGFPHSPPVISQDPFGLNSTPSLFFKSTSSVLNGKLVRRKISSAVLSLWRSLRHYCWQQLARKIRASKPWYRSRLCSF